MSGHHEPVGERQGRQPAQESVAATTESRCACGHTDDWHSHEGQGDCEHDGECECRSFAALSTIQCAAYIGRAHGRCPNMGLRQHDELIDADGTGRMVWVSWCGFHKRWNEEHRG